MPRRLKVCVCATFLLAVLFYLFFQVSKHDPALSQVKAFAEDPYDAIGSFGIQFAVFAALLAVIRAFRPYPSAQVVARQQVFLARTAFLSCLSVAVTLLADSVAMLRYTGIWLGSSAGRELALLLGGMLLLTALIGWSIVHSTRRDTLPPMPHMWTKVVLVAVISILILAFYPASWRQSVPGELLTVCVGTILLFVPIWIVGTAVFPLAWETQFEDFLDDLTALYRWLKEHIGSFTLLFSVVEKVCNLPGINALLGWLSPRKHPWNIAILLGILMGAVLALAEVLGEGGTQQPGRFALVVAIFVSLEAVSVLLGYALLAKPLGLFRHDAG